MLDEVADPTGATEIYKVVGEIPWLAKEASDCKRRWVTTEVIRRQKTKTARSHCMVVDEQTARRD